MTRYFIQPKMATWTAPVYIEDDPNTTKDITVWPDDARDTGVLDLDGNAIMATDQIPIGFIVK